MKIDQIFEHIGNFGRYHQILYVIVFLGGIPNALILLHTVYSHCDPPFHCKLPSGVLDAAANNQTENEALLNYTIPYEEDAEGKLVRSECQMYDRNYSAYDNTTTAWMNVTDNSTLDVTDCKFGYTFYLEEGQNTAVDEYLMVCGSLWKSPLVVSLLQAGMALGCFTGTLADRYGRRPVFLCASLLQVIFTALGALSWDYYSYAVSMFLAGCVQLVNYVASFVLVSEVIAVRLRNFIAISQFFAFAFGYCVEPLLGYLFPNWRHLLWAVTALSACCYLPAFWLLPESARWLMTKGRKEEGIKELKRMAKMNKSNLNVEDFVKENMLDEDIEEENTPTLRETVKVLFWSGLTSRFLCIFYLWFVCGFAYYGISLYSTSFSDNQHINLLCGGLAEIPAYIGVFFAVKWIGRPRIAFFLMLICGSTNIVLPFLTEDLSILRTVLAMFGKGAASASFYAAYFISAEVSPTLQRSSSMSMSSFSARVGGFGVPFLMTMRTNYPSLPNVIMGSVAITCGVMCIFFIPETKGVPMPDSTTEAVQNRRFYGLKIWRNLAPEEDVMLKEKHSVKV